MHIIHQTSSIVAIATVGSNNAKTGPMVQIWILDSRMHPVESRRSGADASNQCEGCPLASGNGCYVSPNPLGAIWRAWQRGAYTPLDMGTPEWERFWRGADVRFGAYGNPSNLPLLMIEDIVRLARRHTGYFHDWEVMGAVAAKQYGRFFMASTSPANDAYARNLGLRTFCVGDSRPKGAIECLADARGLQCADCGSVTARSVPAPAPAPSLPFGSVRMGTKSPRPAPFSLNPSPHEPTRQRPSLPSRIAGGPRSPREVGR